MNRLPLLLALLFAYSIAFAGKEHDHDHDHDHIGPDNISYLSKTSHTWDMEKQALLAGSDAWRQFTARNATWHAGFDERSGKPRRAYGAPLAIVLPGADVVSKAMHFLNSELSAYTQNTGELIHTNTRESAKYRFVDFVQYHKGLEVLNSRVSVRMTLDDKVVMFGLESYDNISIDNEPRISAEEAMEFAAHDLESWEQLYVNAAPDMKILPIPVGDSYVFRLVYEVDVRARNVEDIPVWLYTLVDAQTGDMHYRINRIHTMAPQAAEITVEATVHTTHPFDPSQDAPLANLRVQINGRDYYTDGNGVLDYDGSTPVQGRAYLEGRWAKVVSGSQGQNAESPNISVTIEPGVNVISMNSAANIQHLSGYYHTNLIHDFMKAQLPEFTNLDFPLLVRVDRGGGACNAFYDGASINFFAPDSRCHSYASVGTVVYHEYGHAINAEFYAAFNQPFQNGAMHEGYADVWAMVIIQQGVIGFGGIKNNPNAAIRRYSETRRRVYPDDIVGQVHRDGEIIAGAWWDLARLLQSYEEMTAIFVESLYGLANGPNGAEGQVYSDILLDALLADDDNANLADGTPNMEEILEAFRLHGIVLRSGRIDHEEVEALPADRVNPLVVESELPEFLGATQVRGDIVMRYRTAPGEAWQRVVAEHDAGDKYRAMLPAQQPGTVVQYYFELTSTSGDVIQVDPPGIETNETRSNLPYVSLVGYHQIHKEDFDTEDFSDWTIGSTSDDAVSGIWEIGVPNATFFNGVPVQTGFDNTGSEDDSNICAFTGNTAPGGQAGANDVDNGRTTIFSPVYDLRQYKNPAFAFHRWYSNDRGANPANDSWEVSISGNGQDWISVENTRASDASWRRMAFRVLDYLDELSATTQLRFVASDVIVPGAQQNGGSLVEAAVDDLTLYDTQALDPTSVSDGGEQDYRLNVFPNPATAGFSVDISGMPRNTALILRLSDLLGTTVLQQTILPDAPARLSISAEAIPTGVYTLSINGGSVVANTQVRIVK